MRVRITPYLAHLAYLVPLRIWTQCHSLVVKFHWGKVSLRVTWQPQPMRRQHGWW